MATMLISGPYLKHWPGVLAELERLNIALETLRYVEVAQKEPVIREWQEGRMTARKEIEATAVLHSGERVTLTLTELIYDGKPVQG